MALFLDVEKHSMRARLVYLTIYALLSLGSVTMIYPLMIMLSSSVSSEVDYERYHMLPYYLWDDDLLWRKYLGLKYDRDFIAYKHRCKIDPGVNDFRYYAGKFDRSLTNSGPRRRVEDWREFKDALPLDRVDVFFTDKYRMGPTQMRYHEWLAERYDSIQEYNLSFEPPKAYRYFNDIDCYAESIVGHNWQARDEEPREVYLEFKESLPPAWLRALAPTHLFQEYLLEIFKTIENANRELGTDHASFYEFEFTAETPETPALREVWTDFVRERYPMRYVRVPGDHTEAFKAFILTQEEFDGDPKVFDEVAVASQQESGAPLVTFDDLRWTATMPVDDLTARLWVRFVDELPPREIEFYDLTGDYRRFLERRYDGSVAALNDACGTDYASFGAIDPPYREADAIHFADNKGHYRRYFLTSNFTRVFRYIFANGFALKNTIILVALWVLGNLTVQPMAAYALSRFNLSYSNRILLFLIATMSFPHSVTMIPNFLLLKKLHLLNTYAALILPHLVHGMGIFLLKGYFDSLPRELYEAGMIDGASEMQMFYRITLPLSMPILAVIGLQSFAAAYGSFMWAFLICQDESMWTLMVFLYQFKQIAPPYTHMAALVIAGIPTLIVFILAQRVIMRGIVIPTMK